jgi:glucokinase
MTIRADQYAIGIDIGGTGTKYGFVNHRGDISFRGSDIRTNEYDNVEDFVDDLHKVLKPSVDLIGLDKIRGIGVGAPNGNIYTGTIEYAPNLPWTGIIPLAQLISDKFGLPCSLTNDANAAAVGEMMYGAARGMRDFIVITLGTGVGSGIFSNGQLIYGHDGFAGELGHTIIRPGGRQHHSTGAGGSLETYASATGIALSAIEILANTTKKSALRNYNYDQIDSKLVYECAMNGDEVAQEVYRFTGQILGESLANFIMLSSPEAIILLGGVIKAGDLIMKPTKEHMEKNLLPIFKNKVKLIMSELKEADAAILGASALVWEMREV